MACVLLEEVLIGLEEAKDALEQAVATLVSLAEDLTHISRPPGKR